MKSGSCCIPPERDGRAAPDDKTAAPSRNRSWKQRLVRIGGGRTFRGTASPVFPADGESPVQTGRLKPYAIDPFTVTNRWFSEFIDDTGYKTDAERFGWSLVFWDRLPSDKTYQRVAATPWWCRVDGAAWHSPFGPVSSSEAIPDHPVTHVSWNDATAFARWAGGRLPTEMEWEHAARGGLEDAIFPWGDEEPDDRKAFCNIWQGEFPRQNTALDGYAGTAPVQSFQPNGFGLYNMVGNVWEWCSDMFLVRSQAKSAKLRNTESRRTRDRVLKGGSHLCHISYCFRYRVAARIGVSQDSSTGHAGFRVVASV